MRSNLSEVICEYNTLTQLHQLLLLSFETKIKLSVLEPAIKEAHDRINNGLYIDIDELIELKTAISLGTKRYQELKEVLKAIDGDVNEIKYILN